MGMCGDESLRAEYRRYEINITYIILEFFLFCKKAKTIILHSKLYHFFILSMKNFYLSIIIITIFSLSLQVFASESPVQKIYKIENFKWNEMNKTYDYL